jgi:hypothetical protein
MFTPAPISLLPQIAAEFITTNRLAQKQAVKPILSQFFLEISSPVW